MNWRGRIYSVSICSLDNINQIWSSLDIPIQTYLSTSFLSANVITIQHDDHTRNFRVTVSNSLGPHSVSNPYSKTITCIYCPYLIFRHCISILDSGNTLLAGLLIPSLPPHPFSPLSSESKLSIS